MAHFVSLKFLWNAVKLERAINQNISNSAVQLLRANKQTHTWVTINRQVASRQDLRLEAATPVLETIKFRCTDNHQVMLVIFECVQRYIKD